MAIELLEGMLLRIKLLHVVLLALVLAPLLLVPAQGIEKQTGSARTAARVTGIGVASSNKKATKEAAPVSYARIAVVGCAKTRNTMGCDKVGTRGIYQKQEHAMLRSESTKYTDASPTAFSTGETGASAGQEADPIEGTKRRDARTTTSGYAGPDAGSVVVGA